jgi:hypothetical protein
VEGGERKEMGIFTICDQQTITGKKSQNFYDERL